MHSLFQDWNIILYKALEYTFELNPCGATTKLEIMECGIQLREWQIVKSISHSAAVLQIRTPSTPQTITSQGLPLDHIKCQ
jgi:hypothetical protein